MINKILLILAIIGFLGCQESPENLITPLTTAPSIQKPAGNTVADNFNFTESGYITEIIASGLTAPEGSGMHGNGVLFAVQSTKANIMKITPSGKTTELAQIPYEEPPAAALIDLLIDPPRGMFVTLLRHGKIFNVSFNGKVSEFASGLNFPLFMALDSDKNIYVSELFGYRITRFDPSGTPAVVIELDSDTRPRGIAFDNDEILYVLSGNGEIRSFNIAAASSLPMPLSSGVLIATVATSGNEQVQDMTFGFDGDIFVVSSFNVYRVKLTGEVALFGTGLRGPYNVINTNIRGDLIVSDYADNEQGSGYVMKIYESKKLAHK